MSVLNGQMFGYDDGAARRWINLDQVAHAAYFRDQKKAEVFLNFGIDGAAATRVELTGDVAEKFDEAMRFIQSNCSHVAGKPQKEPWGGVIDTKKLGRST